MRSAAPAPSVNDVRATRSRQLLWAGVMAVSILSAYVYTVNESVARGETQREARRAAQHNVVAQAHHGSRVANAQYAYVGAP